jgi:phosphate transport system permease protein
MLVAVPIGLMIAIYLSEYANGRCGAVVKPMLEVLAGIPTVVYGFFAVLTVAPALRGFADSLGIDMSPNSALVRRRVMGIMIIPFISSLSDDAMNAVPQSCATARWPGRHTVETITRGAAAGGPARDHGRRAAGGVAAPSARR